MICERARNSTAMSWFGHLPYFKILPYIIYMCIYFGMTGADKEYPAEELKTVVLKALPIVSLIFMVMSCVEQNKEHKQLKTYIVVGLLFSMLGDACLVWRVKLFIPGLLFFAIAQGLYTYAYGLYPFGGPGEFLACYLSGGYIFYFIMDGIDAYVMKLLVLLYTVLIITMGWRIAVRLIQNFNLGNLCGFVGATLFVASDTMIAVDKFKFPVPDASFRIMLTYFFAQLGIALSASFSVVAVMSVSSILNYPGGAAVQVLLFFCFQ